MGPPTNLRKGKDSKETILTPPRTHAANVYKVIEYERATGIKKVRSNYQYALLDKRTQCERDDLFEIDRFEASFTAFIPIKNHRIGDTPKQEFSIGIFY